MTKENISKMKMEPALRENIFANDISDKGLISKIYKEHDSNPGRQTIQLKKWGKDLNRHFSEEDIQRSQRYERVLSITSHQRDAN